MSEIWGIPPTNRSPKTTFLGISQLKGNFNGLYLQLRFEAQKDVKLEMLSRRAALSGNTSLLLPPYW